MTSVINQQRMSAAVPLSFEPFEDVGARPDQTILVERAGWSLVALLVGLTGVQSWAGSLILPGDNIASIVLIGVSLIALWRCWIGPDGPSRRLQTTILIGLGVGTALYAAQAWWTAPGYGTDAAAFDQYAAQLALHGLNPYTHSMAPALELFRVPVSFHTFLLDGGAVTSLSYPAGSFVPYMPLLALGIHAQVANICGLAAWMLGIVLLWRLLPRRVAWVAPILGSAFVYVSFIVGGLTDALFVPFVLLAVWRWDRYADPLEKGVARWIGPVTLGIAMSIKQTPWLMVPFLLIGIYYEARRRSQRASLVVVRYCLTAAFVFLVFNLPFVVSSPTAWAKGILLPIVQSTIPDGQGLVNLTTFERLGGGDLRFYSLAGAAAFLFAIAIFGYRYPRLKRAWVPLVGLSLFFPSRSFGSYLFMLVPAAFLAATSVAQVPIQNQQTRLWRLAALGSALAALGGTVGALVVQAPLSIAVVGSTSTGQLATLEQVEVRVTNRSSKSLRPHFTVNSNDHVSSFWYPYEKGRPYTLVIRPHASVLVSLRAPDVASQSPILTPVIVDAFTKSPDTMSSSSKYVVGRGFTTYLSPSAVDAPIRLGDSLRFTVQLQNRFGSSVSRAGVKIELGQTIYAQESFYPGESSINGSAEGKTPVAAVTNELGQATFVVRGLQAQNEPIYYQAWIVGSQGIPNGYSNLVLVQFLPSS